ncbi:trihelix transcription factor GT-3a-like [Zingiber officinale]|uniref:Myb-like domain-containing protein n=1 Tax=Zingiber officinale TaxID=94328 RepID=A0A8J5HK84_ZINOF|nr:trihelix transcription factor GT-3a-like [Zingiber officinale]KAG6518136.1 hypothetical protein ZIOFF_021538 [Zingiber officinale]
MEHHHGHLHHHRLNPYQTLNPGPVASAQDPDGGGGGGGADQRLPQWSHEETRELLSIRAQLDKSFTETKRNKPLWEATSSLLLLKGFCRTPEQCKSKWKNLVTRFKGSESLTESEKQHFPFYEDMRRIFSDRAAAAPSPSEKGKQAVLQVKELDERELASEEEDSGKAGRKKKRKLDHQVAAEMSKPTAAINVAVREFMRQQMEMEARWLEATESRELARRAEEEEWRRLMEALRAERAEMDRRWRAREEERRAREEARAERRHQLLVALLDKLISQKD